MSTAAGPTKEKTSGAERGCSSREGPHAAAAVPIAHALRFTSAVCRRAAVEASVDHEGAAHARGYTWLPLCPAGWGAIRRGARADAPERLVADACLRPIHETIKAHTASSPMHVIGMRLRASLGHLQPGVGESAVGLHITLPSSSPLSPQMNAPVHAEFRADRLSYWSTLSSWDAESKARAALNLNLNARLDPRMSGGRRIHRAQARVPRDLAELQRCDDFRALHVLGDFGAENAEVEVGLVVLRGDIYVRGADGFTPEPHDVHVAEAESGSVCGARVLAGVHVTLGGAWMRAADLALAARDSRGDCELELRHETVEALRGVLAACSQ